MNLAWALRNMIVVLSTAVAFAAQAASLTASSSPPVVELKVAGGRLEGPSTVRIRKGETVVLRWRVDRPMQLHMHGYEIQVDAKPGTPAAMVVEGRFTGRFPVSVHGVKGHGHDEPVLLYLEVLPE